MGTAFFPLRKRPAFLSPPTKPENRTIVTGKLDRPRSISSTLTNALPELVTGTGMSNSVTTWLVGPNTPVELTNNIFGVFVGSLELRQEWHLFVGDEKLLHLVACDLGGG